MALDPVLVQPTAFPYAGRFALEDTAGKLREFQLRVAGPYKLTLGPIYQSDGETMDGGVVGLDQTLAHGDTLDPAATDDGTEAYRVEASGQWSTEVRPGDGIRSVFVGPTSTSVDGILALQVERL